MFGSMQISRRIGAGEASQNPAPAHAEAASQIAG